VTSVYVRVLDPNMDVIPQAYCLFIGLLVTDVIPEALLCAARRKNLFDHDFAAGAKNRN